MKSCQRGTFCAQRELIMGMLGQGQPEAQFSKAGPTTAWMYSKLLSSLKVMVKLTRAAIGSGSIAGETPAHQDIKKVASAVSVQSVFPD